MKAKLAFGFVIALGLFVTVPVTQAVDQAKGGELYKSKCASCHGPDGKGETSAGKALKVKDLAADETQNMHDSELKTLIETGKGKMPAYKGKLTNQEIEDLVQFIRTFKKKS
jgi:cytochrome c6